MKTNSLQQQQQQQQQGKKKKKEKRKKKGRETLEEVGPNETFINVNKYVISH